MICGCLSLWLWQRHCSNRLGNKRMHITHTSVFRVCMCARVG